MRFIVGLFALGLVFSGCAMDATEQTEQTGEAALACRTKDIRYAGQDITSPPEGYDAWGPVGVNDRGDVLGSGLDCDDEFVVCRFDLLELAPDGAFRVVVPDFSANDANARGDVGGCVIEGDTSQAAIVHPNGSVALLPELPGQASSCIVLISEAETAFVSVVDEDAQISTYVVDHRRFLPFTLENADVRDINGRGEVTGILSTDAGDRAFRFDARRQTTTLLEPVEADPGSWGLDIDRQGNVLGYSFSFGGLERIGFWNQRERFVTEFIEGTPEIPTVSNQLIWNERGFIVISFTTDENTYIVPRSGVRLDLADLVDAGSVPPTLFAYNINERDDFLAQSLADGTIHVFRRTD